MWLEQARLDWERLGEADPMWAILSDPDLAGNRWDPEAFFSTGVREVEQNLRHLHALGLDVERDRCLDFGCGIGRLTQALCDHFDRGDGVDVAASMVQRARSLNRCGARCQYHVNQRGDLRLFEDAEFTFVLSLITLQHIEPLHSKRYLAEFMRVLRPGGVALFQIPSALRKAGAGRLPDAAHRASIRAVQVPGRMNAGEPVEVAVQVRNASEVEWPRVEGIRVGNHWRNRRGMVALDDGRASLPRSLQPGESADVRLVVTPPQAAGDYELEFDVVEERITWFADRGSETLSLPVEVRGRASASGRLFQRLGLRPLGPSSTPALPVAEMHCVPQDEVRAVVAGAGGEVVDVSSYDVSGPVFESFRYVAVRR